MVRTWRTACVGVHLRKRARLVRREVLDLLFQNAVHDDFANLLVLVIRSLFLNAKDYLPVLIFQPLKDVHELFALSARRMPL